MKLKTLGAQIKN